MANFVGRYQLKATENFEEFLKEMGLGVIKRKLAASTSPEIEVSQDGDYWILKTKTAIKNSEIKFQLGEEFEELRQDDVKVKSLIRQEGSNKWIHTQTPQNSDKIVTIVREFTDKGIKAAATVGNVTSNREYERVC